MQTLLRYSSNMAANIAFVAITSFVTVTQQADKMVIIMLDGVRYDYIERMTEKDLPNFKGFMLHGTRARYVQPIFPSMSYPSWTSIVTGRYAESHGILGNNFLDQESNLQFLAGQIGTNSSHDHTANPIWWKDHIPLWTTATEHGIRTSLYLWFRCDLPFGPRMTVPEKCQIQDNERIYKVEAFGENLEAAVKDLKDGFGLVMIYHDNIDAIGHAHGPDSQKEFILPIPHVAFKKKCLKILRLKQVVDEVKAVDHRLGVFFDELYKEGLDIKTNIFILSDHGMSGYENKTWGKLGSFLAQEDVEYMTEGGALLNIKVANSTTPDAVHAKLVKWTGFDVYKKEDIPDHLHFRDHRNILDILMVSKGKEMVVTSFDKKLFSRRHLHSLQDRQVTGKPAGTGGTHGWDDTSRLPNAYKEGPMTDMRAIFMARGPGIKADKNKVSNWIKIVDEYQLFCHLLGIEAEPHNGTWARVYGFLRNPPASSKKKAGILRAKSGPKAKTLKKTPKKEAPRNILKKSSRLGSKSDKHKKHRDNLNKNHIPKRKRIVVHG